MTCAYIRKIGKYNNYKIRNANSMALRIFRFMS